MRKHSCPFALLGVLIMLFTVFTNSTPLAAATQQPTSAIAGISAAPQADMVRLELGDSHTCTGTTEGAVWCWGLNSSGQVGDGTTTLRPSPVELPGLIGVTAIAAGGDHTCALTNGGAKCWGENTRGQLGNNTTTSSSTPVDVWTSSNDPTPLSGVSAITAGAQHTCAQLASGVVKCWGNNTNGQLGDGTTTQSLTPIDVRTSSTVTTPLSSVTAVSAGSSHTCALLSTGGVKCWGNNANGQLGDGTTTQSKTPVDVRTSSTVTTPLSGATALDAGDFFTCALMAGGHAKCWGQGGNGQLGNNSTANMVTAPVDVQTSSSNSNPLSGVTAIAGGGYHTCALLSTGGVKCWGYNLHGQLGDGTTTQSKTPVDVSGLASGATAMDTGHDYSCALMSTSVLKCWGYNAHGELGIGTTDIVAHSVPVNVALPMPTTAAVASSINPAVIGQTIVFTATVSTVEPGTTPTGNVTFWDGVTSLGTSTLNGSAQATLSASAAGVGVHSITAVYAGNTGFDASTSPAFSQTINKASTLTALSASPNSAPEGQSVVLTATVTVLAPGAGLPTGTVTFKDGGSTIAGCGTQAVSSARTANCTASGLGVGSHAIAAAYNGDASFVQSTSTALNLVIQQVWRVYIPLTKK